MPSTPCSIFYNSFTYPKVETNPAIIPIVKLIPKLATMPELAPIATPPARVAFIISYMLNFLRIKLVVTNVDMQLPVRATIVLLIMSDL